MSPLLAYRPVIHVDGSVSDLSAMLTSLFVKLLSAPTSNTAFIELDDSAGAATLPELNAGISIFIESAGVPAIEIFGGKVISRVFIGGEADHKIDIACTGTRNSSSAAPPSPVILRAGQDLVAWRIAALGESAREQSHLKLIAHPTLRPGMTVTIHGVRADADGDHRIDIVTHRFTADSGFGTDLTVRRVRR